MKVSNPMAFLLIFALLMVLSGCGGNEGQNLPDNTVAVSQHCIDCHTNNVERISPVTGTVITDEWLRSPHNTASSANTSGIGAGCPNCHTPSHNHPQDCGQCHGGSQAISASFVNPDETRQCNICHAPVSSVKPLGAPHFNNLNGVSHQAQYVDLQNQGKCRNCHNSHDNIVLQEEKDWAVSKHGDVNGVAWTTEDFKSNAECIRCHTATGFVNYVTSTPPFTLPTAPLAAGNTYGVLGCNACHASYDFKNSIRNVPQYTAPYNSGQNPQQYPDHLGYSNICIACHAGRESGASVSASISYKNANFVSSHYMAAAGTMYAKLGFTNFTSARGTLVVTSVTPNLSIANYATSLVSSDDGGSVTSTHGKLRTPPIITDSPFHPPPKPEAPMTFRSGGPCVVCHMTAGHSLKIDPNTYVQVCAYCHPSELGVTLTGSNFQDYFVTPQSEAFQDALLLAETLLQSRYSIKYDPANAPYFFEPSSGQAVTDWTRGGTLNNQLARKLMGACFNINLLHGDPAAYAHARTYTRRLIYDTIDFLDDEKINLSVSATAIATMPSFKKGANAYTDSTLTSLSPGTSESMVFLIGWTRGTGKWSSPERP